MSVGWLTEPWQQEFLDRIDVRDPFATVCRPTDRTVVTLLTCTALEADLSRWDVVTTDPDRAREIRRTARHLAALLDGEVPS